MFYIHNIPGRVRIKSDTLKRNSTAADEIRKALSLIGGIETVDINCTTGSIIHYQFAVTKCQDITNLLETRGFFDRCKAVTSNEYMRRKTAFLLESLFRFFAFALTLLVFVNYSAYADTDNEQQQGQQPRQLPLWFPQLLGAQFTGIYQRMPDFNSPYTGNNSLRFDQGKGEGFTHTYGIYLGSRISQSLQLYLDVEMFKGSGISDGLGLGGNMNGDVVRAGSANLGQDPYLSRFYARYLIPLSSQLTEPQERAIDQLPGPEPADRIEIKAGKLAPPDDFDLNRYANNARTQFLNCAFIVNTAWDYASDTRGYTIGVSIALVHPTWRLIFGTYQVPTTRNGNVLDSEIYRARGDNLELTVKPGTWGTVVRVLAYRNEGRMGDFQQAIDIGNRQGTVPDTMAIDGPGHVKYGFGLNLEQPIADEGETGLFARLGWADGSNSAWSYTEVDRIISAGMQISGGKWGRTRDRLSFALALQGLSRVHRDYLADGGMGMLLGDGKLNYGPENIFEVYYLIQLGRYVQLSPDFQYIENPGFNQDRGPVTVYSLRLRVSY